jgi:predicted TIM-barrel enzyme
MKALRDTALRDTEALMKAGFDGVVFSNEGDRPYLSTVAPVTVAAMARLIAEASKLCDKPFGLSVLADPEAAISVGTAVEADFVRIFLSWVFVGDWGIVDPCAGKLLRLKSSVHGNMKIVANISGHTEPLGGAEARGHRARRGQVRPRGRGLPRRNHGGQRNRRG